MRCFVFGLLLFCCGCAGRTEKIGPAVIDSVNGSEEVWKLFQDDSLLGKDTRGSKDLTSGEEVWGMRLRVADVMPTGLTLICEQSGGNPTGELQTGPMFWLERQVGGVWKSVEQRHSEEDADAVYAFEDIAYILQKGSSRVWRLRWSHLYGDLSGGRYRIGKRITDFRGTGDYDTRSYYAEFEVTTNKK